MASSLVMTTSLAATAGPRSQVAGSAVAVTSKPKPPLFPAEKIMTTKSFVGRPLFVVSGMALGAVANLEGDASNCGQPVFGKGQGALSEGDASNCGQPVFGKGQGSLSEGDASNCGQHLFGKVSEGDASNCGQHLFGKMIGN
ncbi:hypothetical protein LINPERPRIM_LOCUS35805 [Linum perenne]